MERKREMGDEKVEWKETGNDRRIERKMEIESKKKKITKMKEETGKLK